MSTVVDSLLITLGLDVSKFDAAQKKSVEQLRKIDDQAGKTNKNLQSGSKELTTGFSKATESLVAFGAAFVSVGSIKGFVENMTQTNNQIGQNAHLLGLSAQELKTWGDILGTVGGKGEEFTQTMLGLQNSMARAQKGDASIFQKLAFLPNAGEIFNLQTGEVDQKKLADSLLELSKRNRALALDTAQTLGITKSMFLVYEKGGDTVEKLFNKFDPLNKGTNEAAVGAGKLTEKWNDLEKELGASSTLIFNKLTPALDGLLNITTKLFKPDQVTNWASNLVKNLSSVSIPLGIAFKELEIVKDFLEKHASPTDTAESGKSGATRNIRNNNPGNLKFGDYAKAHGATGADSGGFAIFPNMETGAKAQADLLNSKYSQGLDTIQKLYTGSGSTLGWLGNGADLKDASSAIANVTRMTGIGANQHINSDQLEIIRRAVTNNEGMIGSGVSAPNGGQSNNNTTTVNIGTVTTQATDGHKLVGELNQSLQNHALVNDGMIGSR